MGNYEAHAASGKVTRCSAQTEKKLSEYKEEYKEMVEDKEHYEMSMQKADSAKGEAAAKEKAQTSRLEREREELTASHKALEEQLARLKMEGRIKCLSSGEQDAQLKATRVEIDNARKDLRSAE